jgi:acetyl esterase/lipase
MRGRVLALVVIAALAGGCETVQEAEAPGLVAVPAASVTTDVVYGHKDGLALTIDVYRPAEPHGAGVISILSGGWQSSWDLLQQFVATPDGGLRPMTAAEADEGLGRFVAHSYAGLLDRGFTVFAVRHGSSPRYGMAEIVADMRRAVRFIRSHSLESGVDPDRLGVWGGSAGGHLALLLGTTPDEGDPEAAETVLRESDRVAAVVAYFPPTDLARWGTGQTRTQFPAVALTPAEAREYSPIRHVSSAAAPSLILHGDADTLVPIAEGETMYKALSAAGAVAEFIPVEGSGHGFSGSDATRANAAMVEWFTKHLGR